MPAKSNFLSLPFVSASLLSDRYETVTKSFIDFEHHLRDVEWSESIIMHVHTST